MVGADGGCFYFRTWFEKEGDRVQGVGRENVSAIALQSRWFWDG